MCLPCWPFSDVYLEDDPVSRRRQMFQYKWDGQQWVLRKVNVRVLLVFPSCLLCCFPSFPSTRSRTSLWPQSPPDLLSRRFSGHLFQSHRDFTAAEKFTLLCSHPCFPISAASLFLSSLLLSYLFPFLPSFSSSGLLMKNMSSSPASSPTKQQKTRARRVSFNIGSSNPPPAFASAAPPPSKPRRHHHHHFQSQTQPPFTPSAADHWTRVGNVQNKESDRHLPADASKKAHPAKNNNTPSNIDGAPLHTITASAAAGVLPPGSIPNPAAAAAGPNVINTQMNPALGVNPVFTHLNAPAFGYGPQAFGGVLPGYPPVLGGATMAAADASSTGISFIPGVPDATNGPMLHTYIPRNDVPAVGGGVVYLQQPQQPFGFPTTAHGIPLSNIPVAGGAIAGTTAPIMAQPGMPQPVFVQQQPMAFGGCGGIGGGIPPTVMMPGGVGGIGGMPMMMPGNFPAAVHPEPALGVGQTPAEVLQEQLEFAYANNLYEPQDFKPADDDKSRFYWVRELDGNWTQRSRATIDRIGCRWYITDSGVFYAVRLPN